MGKKQYLIIFIIALLAIDQIFKIWVKTHMMIGESIPVFGDWFKILFVENNGMAFGMEFGGKGGKLFLSVFRLVAIAGIGWYILKLIKLNASKYLIYPFTMIFCGAIGNIIDSLFYGLIFNDSHYKIAELFPADGGYASFLHGKVVDMLYFPLYEGVIGGKPFVFFQPVFNLADSYITVGVILLIIASMFGKHKIPTVIKTENKD